MTLTYIFTMLCHKLVISLQRLKHPNKQKNNDCNSLIAKTEKTPLKKVTFKKITGFLVFRFRAQPKNILLWCVQNAALWLPGTLQRNE